MSEWLFYWDIHVGEWWFCYSLYSVPRLFGTSLLSPTQGDSAPMMRVGGGVQPPRVLAPHLMCCISNVSHPSLDFCFCVMCRSAIPTMQRHRCMDMDMDIVVDMSCLEREGKQKGRL